MLLLSFSPLFADSSTSGTNLNSKPNSDSILDAPDETANEEEFNIDDLIDEGALEEEASIYSEAYVVTGTKTKRKAIDSPFTVFSLNRQQIEALAPNDIGDLLRAVPGFDVFKVSDMNFNASEPGSASIYGSQYLVLIDGVSFSDVRGRSADWPTIPVQVDEIERIEYLPGGQSSLYGSYAAIGVLNIITKRVNPDTWDKGKPSSIRARIGSDGLQSYDFSYNNAENKLTSSVWGSFRTIDNHDDTVNYAPPAFANQGESTYKNGGISLKNNFDENRNLRLDFAYIKGDRNPYQPTSINSERYDGQSASISAIYSEEYENNNSFTFLIKNRNTTSSLQTGNGGGDYDETQIEVRKQFTDTGKRIISLGAYYQEISVSGDVYGPNNQNLYESSANVLVEQPLKDNQSILIGLNGYHSSYTGTDPSYKIFYKKKTTKKEAFRFGYSTSVRGPDIFFSRMADYYINPPPTFAPVRIAGGNSDLDNEEFDSFEVSYERRTPSSSIQSRVYKGKVSNRIVAQWDGTPTIPMPGGGLVYPQEFINEDQDNKQIGITTTWDKSFSKKWTSTVTWRYLRAKNEDGQTSFYSPKNVLNFMATYKPVNRWSLNLFSKTTTSYSTEESGSIGTAPVSGYTKLDFAAKYKVTEDGSQQCWIKVTNLTDREVVEAYGLAAGVAGPGWEIGRMFTAGYSFKF